MALRSFRPSIAARRHSHLQIHDRRLHHLQGLIDVAMPQKPVQPLKRPPHRLTDLIRALVIMRRLRQAFRGLLQHGQAHRDMKPVQEMLSLGVEIQLELAHRIAAIGEEGDLLIELVTLRLEHFEGLCRKFCSGGHEGAVASVYVEIMRPGSRTVQLQ